MRHFLITLLLAGLAACSQSPDEDGAMEPGAYLPQQIERWNRVDSVRTYDRQTIYDYIDGAGEVYNSYAFGEVAVTEYANPTDDRLEVEIFDMGIPSDAYGVFSFAREREQAGIGGGYEHRGSVICFWQDRYYVCVRTARMMQDSDPLLTDFARALSELLPDGSTRPPLLSALPADGLDSNSVRFLHNHQSLNYQYYLDRENILELSEQTNIVLGHYSPGGSLVGVIEYPDPDAAALAEAQFRERFFGGSPEAVAMIGDEQYCGLRREGRFLIVVFKATDQERTMSLLDRTRENLTDSL